MTEFHLLRFLKVCGLKQPRFWLNTREKGDRQYSTIDKSRILQAPGAEK